MEQNQPENFRSGYVAVIGKPNVGKSTLINGLLDQKIAAVSPRPQTTRRRQLGILTNSNVQIVFVDTPGIHKPVHKLGEFMNQVALDTLADADVILWLVDGSTNLDDEDRLVAEHLKALRKTPPVILALNKADLLSAEQIELRLRDYLALYPTAQPKTLSALTGKNRGDLLEKIISHLPVGMPFFDEEQVTDLYERDIAVDLIREATLLHLRDEVPHALAVRLDEYLDLGEENARISATILAERETHKGIVIGRGGEMLKRIGTTARQEIEKLTGRKVFLDLRVKVVKNWRDNPTLLRSMGYASDREK